MANNAWFTISNHREDKTFEIPAEARYLENSRNPETEKKRNKIISDEEKRYKREMSDRANIIYRFDLSRVRALYPLFMHEGKFTLLVQDPAQTAASQHIRGQKLIKIFISDINYSEILKNLFGDLKEICEKRKELKF